MIKLRFEVNGSLVATRTLISLLEIDMCRGLRDGDEITLKVEDPEGYGENHWNFRDRKKVPNASER